MNMNDRSPSVARRVQTWQALFLALTTIPLVTSLWTMTVGSARFLDAAQVDVALDSTYRYLGGVYLGLVLLALWGIRRIDRRADAVVVVTGAIFLGGVGRLISLVDLGAPTPATWGVLVIELGALPLALRMRQTFRETTGPADGHVVGARQVPAA